MSAAPRPPTSSFGHDSIAEQENWTPTRLSRTETFCRHKGHAIRRGETRHLRLVVTLTQKPPLSLPAIPHTGRHTSSPQIKEALKERDKWSRLTNKMRKM